MTYEEAIQKQIEERGITIDRGKFRPKYQANGRTVWLGSFEYPEDAEYELLIHRVAYLENEVACFGYDIRDAEVVFDNYLLFPDGTMFNLHGRMIQPFRNQYGIEAVHVGNTTYAVNTLLSKFVKEK